ncbi:carboxypeptidase-like regulatory domain-containing protein [Chitinophaga horti]|uniref:Carboxypeptidase-like regulatory domain-containing protein n=1 Tax=Chitinophaga horti TaxID=2920382 RepID=A0ABY6JBP9_9BACT|nr:carboxypeptidase-like regulatory domain-containing protein [Chitinophaga horti]UYQ95822.1 carboxypeptidase-like regulatory domain-containing protein [Chitinophaga horti]
MRLSRMLALLILLPVVIYYSCRKAETSVESTGEHIVDLVRVSVSGRVTDVDGVPVSGAAVSAGTASQVTDIDGNFYFSDVSLDRTAGMIKVEKAGYFTGIKTLMLETGDNNNTSLQLIKKIVSGTFESSAGGVINVGANEGSLTFTPNALVNATTKQPYKGQVTVYAAPINPEQPNFQDVMPGTLRGIGLDNRVVGLQSFGMLAAELYTANGEKLQLADGAKATWRMPIPTGLKHKAPVSIPLWSLNETTGLWKEEGTASRIGDEYIGVLTHFSFWNYDAPFKVVKLKARLFAEDAPLANARVEITTAVGDNNISGSGYTTAEGILVGMVPANQKLTMNVYNKCGDLVFTQSIDPLFFDKDLGEISMQAGFTLITVQGTVLNCARQPVLNGNVLVRVDAITYRAKINEGRFILAVARCNNGAAMATITADDIDEQKMSEPKDIAVTGQDVDAGEIIVCGETLDQFININIGGQTTSFTLPDDSISVYTNPDRTYVFAHNIANAVPQLEFYFDATEAATGTFGGSFYYVLPDKTWSTASPAITVTRYDAAPGGFIEGTITGTASDSVTTKPLNASFKVRRY